MTSTKYEPPCKAGDTVYVIIKDKNAREVYPWQSCQSTDCKQAGLQRFISGSQRYV